MNKFKKWFENNKKKAIVLAIVLVAILLLFIFTFKIISYLMPNTRKEVYGDRCEITKNYPVAKDREGKIKEFLKDYKDMELVSFNKKCNLIDMIIEVKDSVSASKVKKMAKKLLKVFSEDEYKHYDIELMISSNNEKSKVYPISGSHHKEINGKSNDDFVW